MIYNSLMNDIAINPNDKKTKSIIEQYEQQRSFFLNKRIAEIEETYRITLEEKNILLGFFNTLEREDNSQTQNSNVGHLLSIFKHQKIEDELVKPDQIYQASLGWLRVYWSAAWRQFADYNKYLLSARFAINKHKKEEIKERYEAIAIDDLINDLKETLPSAEKTVGFSSNYFLNPIIDDKGILDIDAKKLKWLKQNNIGENTKKYTDDFQNLLDSNNYNIDRRLDIWNLPLYLSKTIATLRWQDRIAKLIYRKQKNSPALTYQFYNQVNSILKRDNTVDKNGENIINKEGKVISSIDKAPGTTISTIEQITKSNIPALASITSHYLWRWLIETAHKQHLLDQELPYRFEIIGGYPRLGELCGAGSAAKVRDKLKTIVALAAGCSYTYYGKSGIFQGNLLSYQYFNAYGQKSSKLTLDLARPLCPGFVEELPDGNSKYHHQKILIPWVRMPKLVGNNAAHHAPQSSFQLEMNTQMRLRAHEIYENGGILLNDNSMLELAKSAKLSPDLVNKVVDTWVGEEYLERIDDCVYMLGKRYPEARESLFAAAERTVLSAERGRKRKRAKHEKLRKSS